MRDHVVFYLNGKKREVRGDRAGMMLADYLRYEASLTGTKIVCAEGDCGACTVLRNPPGPTREGTPEFLTVNSCVTLVAQMDGSSLVTLDALASLEGDARVLPNNLGLTPVQQAMMKCHGSQCGFCTPGFVMALTGLVETRICRNSSEAIGTQEAKNALTGNLCRCTGYQPILDAATSIEISACTSVRERFHSGAQQSELDQVASQALEIRGDEFIFHAPVTLSGLQSALQEHAGARMISGGTDLGVVHNKRKSRLIRAISAHLVAELRELRASADGTRITVGANVTLSELRRFVSKSIPELARFLDLFASPQIKNVATLVGNLCNASPIGDTPPFLLVAGAEVEILGAKGTRRVSIDDFYKGYRKTALEPGEAVTRVEFDVPGADETLALYKVSNRKDLDISSVNAAIRANRSKGPGNRMSSIRIALGGVAATPLRFRKTEAVLRDVDLTSRLIEQAVSTLQSEMVPLSDLRGTSAFRRVVAENLLRKFFREHAAAPSTKTATLDP